MKKEKDGQEENGDKWRIEREKHIQEINKKKLRYLKYIMQKNERMEKYIQEQTKRAIIIKKTWSMGEKLRTIIHEGWKCNALEHDIMWRGNLEVEKWGMTKSNKNTKKWILGLDRETPNHILKEMNMKKIKTEAIRRVKYEEKARMSRIE